MAKGGSPTTMNTGNPLQAGPLTQNPITLNNPVQGNSGMPLVQRDVPNTTLNAPNSPSMSALMNQLKLGASGQGPGAPAAGGANAPGAAGQDAVSAMMAAQQGTGYAPTGGAAAAASAQAKIAELLKMLA